MNRFFLAFTSLSLLSFTLPATAQLAPTEQLRAAIQEAVCLNNWEEAIELTSSLMGRQEIDPVYRQQLLELRYDLIDHRNSQTVMDNTQTPQCRALFEAQEAARREEANRPVAVIYHLFTPTPVGEGAYGSQPNPWQRVVSIDGSRQEESVESR